MAESMIRRKRLSVYTDDCLTHDDISAVIEREIEKTISKELRLSYNNIINIKERNMNDSYYDIVIYYKDNT